MSERNQNILKSSLGVSFATLLSRILGLARVMLEASVLGGGSTASGWFLAFMWPNIFRRLLGEGALGTALMPIVSQSELRHGRRQVREELTLIFLVLGAVLALIALAVSGAAIFLRRFDFAPHIMLALNLMPLLMPYAVFICLTGVIGAVLNVHKLFFLPALGALFLNIFMIGGLVWWRHEADILPRLSYLVLAAGAVQLALMVLLLRLKGLMPVFSRAVFGHVQILKELVRLALPGFAGGAAIQISFLADRIMASSLGGQAVPALGYSDRIIDLPIGLFAVSFGTVLMAGMSRSAAQGRMDELCSDLLYGLRIVAFICVPMAFFVVFFHREVFTVLLFRGNFSAGDLMQASQAALYMGIGIPFFCSYKVILPAFYARRKMQTVFRVSLCCVVLNVALNAILMFPLKQGGIALATVISSMVNNILLILLLYREGLAFGAGKLAVTLIRACAASAAAAAAGLWLPDMKNCWADFAATGAVFALVYLALSALLQGSEFKDFFQIIKMKAGK